jgi:hypothetical protein
MKVAVADGQVCDPRSLDQRRLHVAGRRRARQQHDADRRHVADQLTGDVQTAVRRHDLDWVPRETERRSEGNHLRVPHREHHAGAANGCRSGHDRIGRDARQAFVYEVRVGGAAAERCWIVDARISVR